jgi:hypothetical protein
MSSFEVSFRLREDMVPTLRPSLAYIAVGLLAVYSLYHAARMLQLSIGSFQSRAEADTITVLDRNLAPLRTRLALSGCREVGYLTDYPKREWYTGYSQMQYALAPVLVDDSTRPEFIVTNLRDPSSLASIMQDSHLMMVSDYGNGVMLLSRQKP